MRSTDPHHDGGDAAGRSRAHWLVPAIMIVGLATGTITLAAFGWALHRTNDVRAQNDEMATVLRDIIDRTSHWDDDAQADILLLLERSATTVQTFDWLTDRRAILSLASRLNNEPTVSDPLASLLNSLDGLMHCRQSCADWRSRQVATSDALERNAVAAQQAVAQLRATLDQMTGKQRLGRVILLSKLRSSRRAPTLPRIPRSCSNSSRRAARCRSGRWTWPIWRCSSSNSSASAMPIVSPICATTNFATCWRG